MKHIIDAKDKKIGRVASQAAALLIGKNLVSYQRNSQPEVTVTVINASKSAIDSKQFKGKDFERYSGYPGGLRYETIEAIIAKKGYGEILKQAIHGMLPTNKLRPKMMKNLVITE
jgi:large subunit ribosomal protein L13